MKPNEEWDYCGKCYTIGFGTYPFGYCRECWVKAGRPKAMKASIRESKPTEN